MPVLWGLVACLLSACSTPDTVTLVRSLGDTPAEVTVQGETQTRTLRAPGETVDVRDTRMQPRTSTAAETRALHSGSAAISRMRALAFARAAGCRPNARLATAARR